MENRDMKKEAEIEKEILARQEKSENQSESNRCKVSGCYCVGYTRSGTPGICGDCRHYARDHI